MSCSKWRWTQACDSVACVGDCDLCEYDGNFEDDQAPQTPREGVYKPDTRTKVCEVGNYAV